MAAVLIAATVLFGLGIVAIPAAARGDGARVASPLLYGATGALCLGVLALALGRLIAGGTETAVLPLGLPWLGSHFRLDPLSAFFLVVLHLGAAASSLYAVGYGRHDHEPVRVLPFYPPFIAAMTLVVLADDAFTFLVCWELMSLLSWALVMAHHTIAGNRTAGLVYLVMASFGTLALLLAFGLLVGAGGHYAFADLRAGHPSPLVAGMAAALVLVGTGSKAGLVPLHVWLPLAHPAAPSHVSALMSAVMTKVAVYAFARILFDLLGRPEQYWSALPLAVGGATAALGVLHALMENDIKRVLAYSTIENIGFIFAGLGLALAFKANGFAGAAAVALTAALFHVFNHALFKSVLFFGAGAVANATGLRDLDRLGGLIHPMPATAAALLVACLASAALPPLNGFASEWLTFQAILLSPDLPQWGLKLLVPTVGVLLALAAALAAAAFVRFFGIVFLGRPRSTPASRAGETDRWSLAAMIVFAGLCVLAGILPGILLDRLAPAVLLLTGGRMPVQADLPLFSIAPVAASRSAYDGVVVFGCIAVAAVLSAAAIHRFGSRAVRRAPAWDCGAPDPSPLTQVSAGGLAQPIRRVFGSLLFSAREHVDMPPPGATRPARFVLEQHDPVWEGLYRPLLRTVEKVAGRLNVLQFLTIRRYLSLVFLALVLLLTVLAAWQ